MKQVVCAIALVGLLGSVAAAAPAGPVRPMPAGQGAAQQADGGQVQGQDAMMMRALELTPDQQGRWTAEMERTRGVLGPLWERLGTQMAELRALVDRKAADGEVKPKLDAVNATRLAIRTEQDKHETNVFAILTPTQAAKYTMLFAERTRQGWGGGRPMPRGGQRPPVR